MDETRLAKLKRRATQAIESARGDGFAEVVLELIEERQAGLLLHLWPDPVPAPEMEVVSELETTSPKRKRKVAEAGGDLSGSD